MKRLLINIRRLFYTAIFGLPVTIWLLLRDRYTVYYIPHIGLGDYCIALGYLEAFKKKNSIKHITLIVPPNRVEVAHFYPCWDSLLVLKCPLYLGLVCFGGIPIGRTIHQKAKRIKNVSYGIHLKGNLYYNNPSIHVDTVVKNILNLFNDEQRKGPAVPQTDIEGIVEKYDMCFGKTVLLNPYTSGMAVEEIDASLYIKLAGELKAKGFVVVTILGSEEQEPVPGTQGIVTSLAEAWCLARWCGYVIGTRSGFFDFVCFSGCDIVGIYGASYNMRYFFSLSIPNGIPNGEDHVREYILEPGREDELISDILSDCLMWKEAVD